MHDHFIALDWAERNMAVSRMTKISDKISSIDVPSDIKELKLYLTKLKGKKILTFEETTTSQWLYTELRDFVDEIIVCDPFRNRLLSDGPKTDRIDSRKLVLLLKANLLKAVFHTSQQFINLRKLVSGYQDVVKAGVRLKNQRSALFRSKGLRQGEEEKCGPIERFVIAGINQAIDAYEIEKERYELEFKKLTRKHTAIRNLVSIPGIGEIGAVKIVAAVVNPLRFKSKAAFISYCGLIKHEKMSGGRSYGKRSPRYSRAMKSVFKSAAITVIDGGVLNPFTIFYNYLIKEKNYPAHNARHAVARRIAVLALGILKSGKKFDKERFTYRFDNK